MSDTNRGKPALLIDLDGVIYQGDKIIPGATDTIDWINANQIPHLFVTNTTSRSRSSLLKKFKTLGIAGDIDDIITPIVATSQWLCSRHIGRAALFVVDDALPDFIDIEQCNTDTDSVVDAVVIGDLGNSWDYDTLNRAFRFLISEPKPTLIALGMTRYWRSADGLRLDVAPFVKALEHAADCEAKVIGKPSTDFFESCLALLNQKAGNTIMIGDDIVGDIQGAQRCGIRGVLVKTGKYLPHDLQRGIKVDGLLDSIADLPKWWAKQF
jgi:phospholysine phosphohistidine inorganic pyrophosphate phosphatase